MHLFLVIKYLDKNIYIYFNSSVTLFDIKTINFERLFPVSPLFSPFLSFFDDIPWHVLHFSVVEELLKMQDRSSFNKLEFSPLPYNRHLDKSRFVCHFVEWKREFRTIREIETQPRWKEAYFWAITGGTDVINCIYHQQRRVHVASFTCILNEYTRQAHLLETSFMLRSTFPDKLFR